MKLQTTFLVIAVVTSGLGSLTWGTEYGDYQAIEAAVKAGKLTKQEAASKLADLKNAAAKKDQPKASPKGGKLTDYEIIAAKLSELVKAGILSEEQAKAMMAAARKVK